MSRADAAPPSVEFETANRLFFRLYQAANLMHKNGTRSVAGFGTTTQQWAVLGALTRPLVCNEGMTIKSLIEFLLLSRQDLTAVLDRLEARRWIARVTDPEDGRGRLVRLTIEGERIWARMQAPIEAFYARSLAGFSNAELVQLYRLLDRWKTGLNEARGPV